MQVRVQDQEIGNSFVERIIGILKLDRQTYKQIATDPNALPQAVGIVAATAIANGIAETREAGMGILGGILAVVIGWVVVSAIIAWLGRMVAQPGADLSFQSALRLLGYAQAPLVLFILTPLAVIGGLINFGASVWALIAYVIAIQVLALVSAGKAIMILLGSGIIAGLAIFAVLAPVWLS